MYRVGIRAELEEERKGEMEEKQMQTTFVPEISFLSLVTESRNLLQIAIANTVVVSSESTVNRVAQTQLVTHRLRLRDHRRLFIASRFVHVEF